MLDHKVEQLQGDQSNVAQQLNALRKSYVEQSSKLKTEHEQLHAKYQYMSREREQLLLEKQTSDLHIAHSRAS